MRLILPIMNLHVYNPEHDICLADGGRRLSPPRAALLMRAAYGHVPAYWAGDGDMVVVDDPALARRHLEEDARPHARVEFVTLSDVGRLGAGSLPEEILPWGWDRCVAGTLLRANPLLSPLLPSDSQLDTIRRLSSREFAAENILPRLVLLDERLVGEMSVMRDFREIEGEVARRGSAVLKSPWSCSGRGVRILSQGLSANDMGWVRGVLRRQKAMMLEPLYDRVLDFGMEFLVGRDYTVRYLGLSVFDTRRGAYLGNMIAGEEEKMEVVRRHVPEELLEKVREGILEAASSLFDGLYHGPFGVDMMVVDTEGGKRLHPCVELNLRRTMGHAALMR